MLSAITSVYVSEVFSQIISGIGCTNVVQHVIKVNITPIKPRYYPISPALQKEVDKELDHLLENNVIEPSSLSWASPIVMIRRKDGSYRLCVRKLNAVTERDAYPQPYISSNLDKPRNAKYLTTLDIRSTYWQIPIADQSKQYIAILPL